MVELANQIREREGCTRRTAILQAAPQRLRPIMMTAITTVLGMFPLALGMGQGESFAAAGVVVFSGLSLATLLTLFIIPCFYLLLHELFGGKWLNGRGFKGWVGKLFRRRSTTKPAIAPPRELLEPEASRKYGEEGDEPV